MCYSASACLTHALRLAPYLHTFICPFVLADLLVSHFSGYGSTYFGPARALTYIVTYVQTTSMWEHTLLSLVPHTFTLIDTVYIDLTGL
jgi:hypothetical protein